MLRLNLEEGVGVLLGHEHFDHLGSEYVLLHQGEHLLEQGESDTILDVRVNRS